MSKYKYQPVTGGGCGVHGSAYGSLRLAQQFIDLVLKHRFPDAEVERIQELSGGGRRYWLKREGKWVAQ